MNSYKKDFPIFANNPGLVYLDSSATSQKPRAVIDSLVDYYESYNANVRRGLYSLADKATKQLEIVRKQTAAFINAKSDEEIIFVRNTTEAINLVSAGWGRKYIKKGDIVAVTIMEHHSNFVPWQELCNEKQAEFMVLDINKEYLLDINLQDPRIKKLKLLAITHVSNVLGTINPIKKIIRDVRKRNKDIIILVDAAQSIPHMPVDVQDLDCDFLSFSGHKMMAGTGVGVLYGRKSILKDMTPFLFGSDMIKEVTIKHTTYAFPPAKFEAGTPDIADIISLGAAIKYIEHIGSKNIHRSEKTLTEYCMSELKKIPEINMLGPDSIDVKSGVISFTIENIHPHDTAQILGDLNICIRAGHHCAMPLHTRLDLVASARVSFYIYNTEHDIKIFINGIKQVLKVFQKKQINIPRMNI